MPKSSQKNIQQRHERILHLLQQHPDGMRTSQIVEYLNLHRKMVDRDLQELEARYKVGKDGMEWYALPSQQVMPRPLSLEAEEAVMLYLAARLLVKQSDTRNTLGEDVLLKLATSVSEDVGLNEDIQAAAQELVYRPEDERYSKILHPSHHIQDGKRYCCPPG